MGFVGNYAPCGLSPQTDGMPVIQKELPDLLIGQLKDEIPAISFTCPPFLRISRFVTE